MAVREARTIAGIRIARRQPTERRPLPSAWAEAVEGSGSSLEETNRVISDVERILRNTKEVASTSRRTGG